MSIKVATSTSHQFAAGANDGYKLNKKFFINDVVGWSSICVLCYDPSHLTLKCPLLLQDFLAQLAIVRYSNFGDAHRRKTTLEQR